MTPFVIGGLVLGGIYAISTLGLVLTYTSSRVFNFAQGAISFLLAIVFHELAVGWGWNKALAALVAVGVAGPLLGLFLWWALFRHLAAAPASVRLVSTVGLWVALPALTRILFVDEEIFDRTGLGPDIPTNYEILGVAVNSNQIIVVVAAALVAVVMTLVLRLTPFGLAVRASVDSPRMAGIVGVNTASVTAGAWMIGTTLAGIAGLLLVPLRGYTELQFTSLMVASFAGVVIARMHSLVLGFLGSMLIGLLQSLAQSSQGEDLLKLLLPDDGVLIRGVQPSIPFILMIVFLLAYRGLGSESFAVDTRSLADDHLLAAEAGADGRSRLRRMLPALVLVGIVLLLPVGLSPLWEALVAKGLALAVIFLSYVVVTGEGGMISLCQVTFGGIAGAITADLAQNQGMPTLLAVLLAAVVVVPFGLLAALPSLRLGGLYLALATLGFGELVVNTYFQLPSVNNDGSGVRVPRPRFGELSFAGDTAFYYLLVGVFVVVALVVANLKRSTTGLELAAMRSSEPATVTLGISLLRTKLIAFGVSAFLAGLGGGLYVTYTKLSQPAISFNTIIGVVWLAVVVTWGVRSVAGALLAGLTYALFPQLFAEYPWVLLVLFGLIFLGVANEVHRPAAAAVARALAVAMVLGAVLVGTGVWDEVPFVDDHVNEIATALFGLGAIGVAREPRGVVYQAVRGAREGRARRRAAGRPGPDPGSDTAGGGTAPDQGLVTA
jgi:branched-chain amino acid transport system permease protein